VRLLVIEDDPGLNRQLATALTDAGYVVDRAFDGEEGHFLGERAPTPSSSTSPPDDGISALEAWRRAGGMPVLILTARDRWSDKVQGFTRRRRLRRKAFHLEGAGVAGAVAPLGRPRQSELNCGPVRLDTRTAASPSTAIRSSSPPTNTACWLSDAPHGPWSAQLLAEHHDQDFDRDSNTIEVFVGRIRTARRRRDPDRVVPATCSRRPMRANSSRCAVLLATLIVVILVVTGIVLSRLPLGGGRSFDRRLGVYLQLVADVATPDDAGDNFSRRRAAVRAALRLVLAKTRLDAPSPDVRLRARSGIDAPDLDDPGVRRFPAVRVKVTSTVRENSGCACSNASSSSARRAASWSALPATRPRSTTRPRASIARCSLPSACSPSCCC
jgi:two-component system OmpR family response regulator